ncbi:MAG: substrate-binding periplasmic protein [Oligoflexus sp.]
MKLMILDIFMYAKVNLLLLIGLLIMTLPLTAGNKTISFISNDWCPYICSKNGKLADPPGFVWEIVEAAMTSQGYQLSYTDMPYSRAIKEARKGQFQGIVGVYKSEIPDFIFHEINVGEAYLCFFSTDEKWSYRGIQSLDQQTLGVVASYRFSREIDDYIGRNQSDPKRIFRAHGANPLPQLLEMLRQKRISLLLDDMYVTHLMMTRIQIEGIYQRQCLTPGRLFVGFSPGIQGSKTLADDLDRGLQLLKDKGAFTKIVRSYVPELNPLVVEDSATHSEAQPVTKNNETRHQQYFKK